jgi:hypothetical protein
MSAILPLEIIVIANAALILIAGGAVLLIVRNSTKYQRNVGDYPVQQRHIRVMVGLVLFLIIIALTAAALNLFAG